MTRAKLPIELDPVWLAGFCRRWRVQQLSFFGSLIHPDFDEKSDVDVLVEFDAGDAPGFFGIARMEGELSEAMSLRRVDVRTPHDLSPYFRDDVMRTAQVQYAAS